CASGGLAAAGLDSW
nr:immunoglobulin heavy chain junction region [Macaca mulatta]